MRTARVQHPPRTAIGQGLLPPKHLLGQKTCSWHDFTPWHPTGRGHGAHGLRKLLWQPVGRSPPRRRQGPNLTGLQESRGSLGCGRGREGRARSLSSSLGAAWLQEEGFPPASATHNQALGSGFCFAFGGELWEEMGTRQGSCDEEAEGPEAEG